MSGFVQDWDCTQCKNGKGFQETFKDTEEGYILECLNCKYMEVYREFPNLQERAKEMCQLMNG